jgi:hypothetical protein
MHVPAENVYVQVVHTRMRMHARDNLGRVVAAWWEVWWGVGRIRHHVDFESGLVRRVGGAEVSVLAPQFGCCERLDARDACAYLGEEGRVGGEGGEGVLVVKGWGAGDEEEVDAVVCVSLCG